MNVDINRALMHTQDTIRRVDKIVVLFAQVQRELSVVDDQLEAIKLQAQNYGLYRNRESRQ